MNSSRLYVRRGPQQTLPRLYQSVSDARRALGDGLTRDRERYRLDRTTIHIDIDQLDKLLATTGDAQHELQALETALSLWRGQPLAGTDYPWAESITHQLHATLFDPLERIGAARLQAGDPHGALQAAERAISLDDLHEPSWRSRSKPTTPSASTAASPSTTTHSPTSSTNNSGSNPVTGHG